MALYLGFDSSTQGLTAIAIEVGLRVRRVVHSEAINFDVELPHYGTRYGTNPSADPSLATAPPTMWAEALDRMMAGFLVFGRALHGRELCRRRRSILRSRRHGGCHENQSSQA